MVAAEPFNQTSLYINSAEFIPHPEFHRHSYYSYCHIAYWRPRASVAALLIYIEQSAAIAR